VKILVAGASGLLGHDLCRVLYEEGFSVLAASRERPAFGFPAPGNHRLVSIQLDALDGQAFANVLRTRRVTHVINCAAVTHPTRSEARGAFTVNGRLPSSMSRICGTFNATFIHISTDAVFGPQHGPCFPSAMPVPDHHNLYSRSKAMGERIQTGIVVRTSFVGLGHGHHRSGLLDRITTSTEPFLDAFPGCAWNGTTTLSLSRCLCCLITQRPASTRVVQVASTPATKYDLVTAINNVYGLRKQVRTITPPFSTRILVPSSGFFVAEAIHTQLEEYRDWRERED